MTALALMAVSAGTVYTDYIDISGEKDEGVEVMQCTNETNTCEKSRITEYAADCKPYSAWDDISSLDCNYTDRNIEEISMVTDSANYVTVPMSDRNYTTETLAATGIHPWDLEFLPSGKRIWTSKNGSIKIYDSNEVRKIDELEVLDKYELGLLGLAIDPDFEENNYIYVYYTGEETDREVGKLDSTLFQNYVARFTLTEEGLTEKKELIELPGSKYHSGGRLEFGPDGKLYVTTGESGMLYKASNRSNLAGKILRLNPDGSIPSDNPFNGSPVYSMGHRNPQGLAWSPEGQLYNTEHGNWRHDELNRIKPGGKYGWSGYHCGEKRGIYGEFREDIGSLENYYNNTPSVHCWDEWTMAPSGATFVNDTESPWHGDLFVAGLRGKQIMRFVFEQGEVTHNEIFYTSANNSDVYLRMRDVEHYNGSLYAISDIEGMVKITPD